MSLDGSTSRWIDDLELDEEPAPQPGSRRRSSLLLLGAAVPWLLVVALLVVPGRIGTTEEPSLREAEPATDEPTTTQDSASGGTSTTAPSAPDGGTGGQGALEQGTDTVASDDAASTAPLRSADGRAAEFRGAWRVEAGAEEAAALAVVLARAWLTTLEPALEIPGTSPPAGQRYAEHLVVEAVEQPSRDAAVVTVLAVVLEGDPILEAHVRRLAVPIVWDHAGPRPGGPPWALPAPSLIPQALATAALDEPAEHDAVHDALVRAGYLDPEVLGVEASAAAVIAAVRASTADGVAVDGPVWLRRHLDGYVVSGTTLTSSDDGRSSPAPDAVGDAASDAEGAAG